MKAHRRPVSGCGSQRMLHALERRSHPADHGPSFASLYSPFCLYATSSPVRGKSLLAGGGQLSCNSRAGQIKNALAQCSSNHIRHSYRMGLATTTTAASGRCRKELLGQRPARRKCRPRHARMLGAATRGTKKEPTGLFFAACGRPCSFDSSYGLHETATTIDIPSRWDARANQSPTGALVAVLRTAALSRVVVPSVCFTPWSGVRIPLTTAPSSLPCFRRWRRSAQLQFPYGSN